MKFELEKTPYEFQKLNKCAVDYFFDKNLIQFNFNNYNFFRTYDDTDMVEKELRTISEIELKVISSFVSIPLFRFISRYEPIILLTKEYENYNNSKNKTKYLYNMKTYSLVDIFQKNGVYIPTIQMKTKSDIIIISDIEQRKGREFILVK